MDSRSANATRANVKMSAATLGSSLETNEWMDGENATVESIII